MPKPIEVEYSGVKYPSLKEFCRECNLDYNLISGRVLSGWSLEDAINKPRIYNNKAKGFSYNGNEYSSISSFCKEHGLNYQFVRSRLKRGWSLEDAISKPKKTTRAVNITSYRGKEYDSVMALCKEHDLDYDLVTNRLRCGWNLEDALSRKKLEYGVLYDGKLYKSGAELAREFGISISTFKSRLYHGYSIEESIVISDIKLKKQSDFFYECRCKHCGLQFLGTLDIAKKHAREHKEDYENMILNYQD